MSIELRSDEKVLAEVRRHWFFIAIRALGLGVLAIIPLLAFVATIFGRSFIQGDFILFLFVLYGFYLLVLWIIFYIFLTTYYLDVWYITNQRIVDVEQHTLFSREVTTFHYDRIQDVTVEVAGIVATFLKYGTLHIQTAGDDRDIKLTLATKPYEAKELINKQLDKRSKAVEGLQQVLGRIV